ncbi:hypothetical protein [Rickettsia endosymbiont of Pantilius tunicatus]|uniref:hypothetical protein n=1 Tax=Rickettsia endosymbiont of Pantilius tunicatus TaxID=3066267 RepID=UPI00376ED445
MNLKITYILLINKELDRRSFIWKRARRLEADNRSVLSAKDSILVNSASFCDRHKERSL